MCIQLECLVDKRVLDPHHSSCTSTLTCSGTSKLCVLSGGTLFYVAGLCNAGYFCVEGSSSASSQLCPTGHFCPQGTAVPERCPEVRGAMLVGSVLGVCVERVTVGSCRVGGKLMQVDWTTDPRGWRSWRGDGVAQLVEHWTRDPKTRGSNPVCVKRTRKNCESFSESKMLC